MQKFTLIFGLLQMWKHDAVYLVRRMVKCFVGYSSVFGPLVQSLCSTSKEKIKLLMAYDTYISVSEVHVCQFMLLADTLLLKLKIVIAGI